MENKKTGSQKGWYCPNGHRMTKVETTDKQAKGVKWIDLKCPICGFEATVLDTTGR